MALEQQSHDCMNKHSDGHNHDGHNHDGHNNDEYINPWSNPFCMQEEPLLMNPTTKQIEDKEHQNKRLELEHFYTIVHSFEYYATWQFARFQCKNYDYNMLDNKYKQITPFMKVKFKKIREGIIQNQSFLTLITQQCSAFISGNRGSYNMNPDFIKINSDKIPSSLNMDKVRSTLKQMARDWSCIGINERENCYGPILKKLIELYPNISEREKINILNPGCGLGRLPWEIARLGFNSQGNEFSYFMLLGSHFVLNKCYKSNMFTIYPFCDINTNQWSCDNNGQLLNCKIPDISPSQLMKNKNKNNNQLSMVAGDFCEIYSRKEQHKQWNVIVSCFFIDTAHNILQYLEIFSKCLKINGYIINLGPLLYHFDDQSDPSIELSYNEIINLLPIFGFKIIYEKKKENSIKCGYAQNENSMVQMYYNSAFWIAQKIKDINLNNFVGGNDLSNNQFLTKNLQFTHQH